MRIGIIGAGLTGLSAALELQKKGYEVHLYEQESIPGGLAMGFKDKNWNWPLEKHYHHIFTSDSAILSLANRTHQTFRFYRPNTSSLIENEILQLDSPIKLLLFPKLSIVERLRMAAILGYLRYIADWKDLEQYKAHTWLQKMMGKKGYTMLWEPLLRTKFGEQYYKDISLAWFWARIKARSTQLGYPDGGFQQFSEVLAKKVMKQKGIIIYKATVTKIASQGVKKIIVYKSQGKVFTEEFDSILVTVPNIIFAAMAPELPETYKKQLRDFKGIGAVNMVLELSKPMLPHNVYWLSICEKEYPFLAVVEHTNFIDKSHYNNNHIVYVGNYLPHGHRYFSLSKEKLLQEYDT
ncbi:MAG TPA: FAD-dependent oxidoreductase, partial [Candidatus Woesebacteria bacterium]|nr:FAD-dependent oxidoreductase [Candidatus Woesebacteria bacterium]